jgi:hypothetical protein
MAYPTGASLNAVLLQQLNFRSGGNYPISSLYTLYANGNGQTYWSNSLSPTLLSAYSTSVGIAMTNQYIELSTLIQQNANNNNNIVGVSSGLSTLTYYTYSTFSTVFALLATSTNLNYAFLSTANSFQLQLNSYYQSTLNVCNSTVNSLANVSSYNSAVSQLQSSTKVWLSTMSTGIGLGVASTTNYLIGLINYGLYSTTVWTAQQISSIAFATVSTSQFNSFSTGINVQLMSTSVSFTNQNSTITNVLYKNATRLSTLELSFVDFSTSGFYVATSTFFSTNIYPVNQSISSLNYNLNSTQSYLLTRSSLYAYDIGCLINSTNTNTSNIAYLSTQFAFITTSSILEGIYESFIELEQYTVDLINSTNAAYVFYLSSALSTQTSVVNSIVISSLNTAISTITSTVTYDYSQLSSLISTSLYNLSSQVAASLYNLSTSVASTIVDTKNSISSLLSSINSVGVITLDSTVYTTYLDFANNRNFVINIYNISSAVGSPYRVSFYPSTLTNITFQQGLILINISTNNQSYTQNSNLLALDFNRWNILNQQSNALFPMIANSAYRIEYIYSIYNSNVYANLVNIWPYQNTSNFRVSSIDSNLALDPNNDKIYSTGTALNVQWNMYVFSTFGPINTFTSQVNIDISISGATNPIQTFGPYSYLQSSQTITMPDGGYPAGTGFVSTTFASYVVGEPTDASYVYGAAYY